MVRQKKSSNRDKSSGPKSVSRSGKSSPAGSSAQTELALGSASACCGCALFSSGGGGGGVADVEEFAAKVVCTICRFFSISGGCRCRRGSAHDLLTPAARPPRFSNAGSGRLQRRDCMNCFSKSSYAALASTSVANVPIHSRVLCLWLRNSATHRPGCRSYTPRHRFMGAEPSTTTTTTRSRQLSLTIGFACFRREPQPTGFFARVFLASAGMQD
jgi:hypothetical protein